MKTCATISLFLLAVSTSSAFTVPQLARGHGVATQKPMTTKNAFPSAKTNNARTQTTSALHLSDNTIDDMKDKAEEATKFLVIDYQQAQNQLAKNWGWIVTSGVLTMGLGAAALLLPVFATGVAYDATVLTIGASGLVGLLAAFARENGHKAKSAISGLLYLGLSYYMGTHPAQGLDIITLSIATVIAGEGLYETALAIRNENLEGRAWHGISGVGSVILGLFLTTTLPASGLVTPGYALGARLTSSGATKVAVGLAGKDIADKRK